MMGVPPAHNTLSNPGCGSVGPAGASPSRLREIRASAYLDDDAFRLKYPFVAKALAEVVRRPLSSSTKVGADDSSSCPTFAAPTKVAATTLTDGSKSFSANCGSAASSLASVAATPSRTILSSATAQAHSAAATSASVATPVPGQPCFSEPFTPATPADGAVPPYIAVHLQQQQNLQAVLPKASFVQENIWRSPAVRRFPPSFSPSALHPVAATAGIAAPAAHATYITPAAASSARHIPLVACVPEAVNWRVPPDLLKQRFSPLFNSVCSQANASLYPSCQLYSVLPNPSIPPTTAAARCSASDSAGHASACKSPTAEPLSCKNFSNGNLCKTSEAVVCTGLASPSAPPAASSAFSAITSNTLPGLSMCAGSTTSVEYQLSKSPHGKNLQSNSRSDNDGSSRSNGNSSSRKEGDCLSATEEFRAQRHFTSAAYLKCMPPSAVHAFAEKYENSHTEQPQQHREDAADEQADDVGFPLRGNASVAQDKEPQSSDKAVSSSAQWPTIQKQAPASRYLPEGVSYRNTLILREEATNNAGAAVGAEDGAAASPLPTGEESETEKHQQQQGGGAKWEQSSSEAEDTETSPKMSLPHVFTAGATAAETVAATAENSAFNPPQYYMQRLEELQRRYANILKTHSTVEYQYQLFRNLGRPQALLQPPHRLNCQLPSTPSPSNDILQQLQHQQLQQQLQQLQHRQQLQQTPLQLSMRNSAPPVLQQLQQRYQIQQVLAAKYKGGRRSQDAKGPQSFTTDFAAASSMEASAARAAGEQSSQQLGQLGPVAAGLARATIGSSKSCSRLSAAEKAFGPAVKNGVVNPVLLFNKEVLDESLQHLKDECVTLQRSSRELGLKLSFKQQQQERQHWKEHGIDERLCEVNEEQQAFLREQLRAIDQATGDLRLMEGEAERLETHARDAFYRKLYNSDLEVKNEAEEVQLHRERVARLRAMRAELPSASDLEKTITRFITHCCSSSSKELLEQLHALGLSASTEELSPEGCNLAVKAWLKKLGLKDNGERVPVRRGVYPAQYFSRYPELYPYPESGEGLPRSQQAIQEHFRELEEKGEPTNYIAAVQKQKEKLRIGDLGYDEGCLAFVRAKKEIQRQRDKQAENEDWEEFYRQKREAKERQKNIEQTEKAREAALLAVEEATKAVELLARKQRLAEETAAAAEREAAAQREAAAAAKVRAIAEEQAAAELLLKQQRLRRAEILKLQKEQQQKAEASPMMSSTVAGAAEQEQIKPIQKKQLSKQLLKEENGGDGGGTRLGGLSGESGRRGSRGVGKAAEAEAGCWKKSSISQRANTLTVEAAEDIAAERLLLRRRGSSSSLLGAGGLPDVDDGGGGKREEEKKKKKKEEEKEEEEEEAAEVFSQQKKRRAHSARSREGLDDVALASPVEGVKKASAPHAGGNGSRHEKQLHQQQMRLRSKPSLVHSGTLLLTRTLTMHKTPLSRSLSAARAPDAERLLLDRSAATQQNTIDDREELRCIQPPDRLLLSAGSARFAVYAHMQRTEKRNLLSSNSPLARRLPYNKCEAFVHLEPPDKQRLSMTSPYERYKELKELLASGQLGLKEKAQDVYDFAVVCCRRAIRSDARSQEYSNVLMEALPYYPYQIDIQRAGIIALLNIFENCKFQEQLAVPLFECLTTLMAIEADDLQGDIVAVMAAVIRPQVSINSELVNLLLLMLQKSADAQLCCYCLHVLLVARSPHRKEEQYAIFVKLLGKWKFEPTVPTQACLAIDSFARRAAQEQLMAHERRMQRQQQQIQQDEKDDQTSQQTNLLELIQRSPSFPIQMQVLHNPQPPAWMGRTREDIQQIVDVMQRHPQHRRLQGAACQALASLAAASLAHCEKITEGQAMECMHLAATNHTESQTIALSVCNMVALLAEVNACSSNVRHLAAMADVKKIIARHRDAADVVAAAAAALKSLDRLSQITEKTLDRVTLAILLNTLRNSAGQLSVVIPICALVRLVAPRVQELAAVRTRMVQLEAVEALVKAITLSSNSVEACTEGCEALSGLIYQQPLNSEPFAELVRYKAMTALLFVLLKHHRVAPFTRCCLRCIANCAVQEACAACVMERGLKVICKAMDANIRDIEVVAQGCRCLGYLLTQPSLKAAAVSHATAIIAYAAETFSTRNETRRLLTQFLTDIFYGRGVLPQSLEPLWNVARATNEQPLSSAAAAAGEAPSSADEALLLWNQRKTQPEQPVSLVDKKESISAAEPALAARSEMHRSRQPSAVSIASAFSKLSNRTLSGPALCARVASHRRLRSPVQSPR